MSNLTQHCLTAVCMAMLHQVTDQYNEKWRYDWVISDFWYALNYVFLAAICFLFRPSFNSTRYAYSELEGGSSVMLNGSLRCCFEKSTWRSPWLTAGTVL